MKFILITPLCLSILFANDSSWDDCARSPGGSPTNHGRVFAPDPKQASAPVEQPSSVPHCIEQTPSDKHYTKTPHAPDKTQAEVTPPMTDKQKNTAWGFVTNYKLVIPCVTLISYIAYRCLRKS